MTTRAKSQRGAFAFAGERPNPLVSQADRRPQLPTQSPAFLPADQPLARDCDTTPRYEEFESGIQGASITVTASIHNDVATTPDHNPATKGDTARSWFVVAAAFVSTFTVFGIAYSFGAFFTSMADEFGTDAAATSVFFAITAFLFFLLGAVTGPISDRIGPRRVLVAGAVCMTLGLLATSQVQSLWLGYLTYGLGVGIGVACGYIPMVAAVGQWFERGRTTALGIAVAGIGMGTLTIAPLAEWLIDRHGWRTTYVILAVGAALSLGIASLGAFRPPSRGNSDPACKVSVTNLFRSREYRILYLSLLLMSLALFLPFVFISDYMATRGVSGSPALLIGLIGAASVAGRLGLGALASRTSCWVLYRLSFLVLGLSFVLWLEAGDSYGRLVVFAVTLGVGYGGIVALAPAVIVDLRGSEGLGTALGVLFTAAGVGGLIGPPAIGLLIDRAGYRAGISTALVVSMMAWVVVTRTSTAALPDQRHPMGGCGRTP